MKPTTTPDLPQVDRAPPDRALQIARARFEPLDPAGRELTDEELNEIAGGELRRLYAHLQGRRD